jgi:exo-1,4-beta-D-glucosaminidase
VYFDVELENPTNDIAFFIEMRIVDKNIGATILPVLWTDNYVSLLPKEKHKYTAKINKIYLKDKNTELIIKGWNVE